MGLRDAFKALRGAGSAAQEQNITDDPAPEEASWFRPRYDGSYDVDPAPHDAAPHDPAPHGGAVGVRLRFLPGGKVFESAGGDVQPGPEQHNPCRGEYTAAGRFNVQRQFERIISYAVLDVGEDGFTARRVDAADGSMAELHFTFRPDTATAEGPPAAG